VRGSESEGVRSEEKSKGEREKTKRKNGWSCSTVKKNELCFLAFFASEA
jgi:hypothetical protein